MAQASKSGWTWTTSIALAVGLAVTVAAALTGAWVLTSLPIGLLFGFFLERSDLCGSSAMSEVVLMRDGRKLFGLWVAIVVSMALFALGDGLGLIRLSPKPLFWANILIGGAAFGVGIVLAGGCISGVLFKAGQGNLNSMAALVAVPAGIAAVLYGPLHGPSQRLHSHVLTIGDGQVPTLANLTGVPFWLLALLIAVTTVALAGFVKRRLNKRKAPGVQSPVPVRTTAPLLGRPWRPWQSGIAIGCLSLLAYMSSAESGRNYPLGTAEGVIGLAVMAVDSPDAIVWHADPAHRAPADRTAAKPPRAPKKVVLWMVLLVVGLVAGSHLSARLRGSFRLLPKPPDETLVAFVGGFLTGAGAAFGGGCVIGHILSGVALLSLGSILFFAVVIAANWMTTRLYLMGR